MSYGLGISIKTMASADSVCSYFDLGSYYPKVYLQIPTMTSKANIQVFAALNPNETFFEVMNKVANTATVAVNSFVIGNTAAANGGLVPLPEGFRFYKIVADSAPTAATTFKLIGAS